MKYVFCLFGLLLSLPLIAQVNDDFSDGDFTSNPIWSGTNDFDASSGTLRLDASSAGDSYLSTPRSQLGATTWEFYFRLAFSASINNQARIYLVSDQSDLSGSLNGYYLQVGQNGSGDVLHFYRQDDADNHTLLFSGTTNLSSSFELWVQVIRNGSGDWVVNTKTDEPSSYTSEISSFSETTFTSITHFGFWCRYSIGNISNFYFDDVGIGFGVSSLIKEGTNSIRVTFKQNVDKTTAETVANYSLNYGFGTPLSATQDLTNLDEVLLTFSGDFVNNDYTLNIDQVENEAQDETLINTNKTFEVEQQTPFRDIVINEIHADLSPQIGLPDAEYLELYNASSQAINIGDFTIDSKTLDDFVLESQNYIILTGSSDIGQFSGNVMGFSSFSLSDAGEALILQDNLGNTVDSATYNRDWYNDEVKDNGGYSLEQINPELACSTENNWTASNDANGGTPGTQNSVYDNSPDTGGPNLIGFIATDANTFRLTFDEPMDETSLTNGTYAFDHGITENGITPTGLGFFSILVDVTPDLTSGVNYTVTVTDVTDCAGNAILTNSLTYTYDTNPPVLEQIVVKTASKIDVIFDEDLDKTIAETESNYTSDHSGLNPTSAVVDDSNATTVSLTFADDFVLNVANTLTIENLQDVQGNALAAALTPTFTLSQQIDTVRVMGINLLDLYFKQDLDATSANTAMNYSVDDEVGNASSAFMDNNNDRLVHLAFANNFDDNKELILSVSNVKNEDSDLLTTPEIAFIYDTAPPKLDTVEVLSASSLAVVFTEKVKKQSAESKENYEYGDIFPIQATLEADQQTVILDFEQDFEREVVFELLIDEVKDLYGNEITTRLKQEFVYDIFAPELDSIIVKSADELILWFNENVDQPIAENTANYTIGNSIGQPSSAVLDLEFQHLVYLKLPVDLPETADISLEISDMKDQRNNVISSALSSSFDYHIFYIGNITPASQTQLEIEFNKLPNATTKSLLANYSINGTTATLINFSEDRIATLTFGPNMEDNSTNALTIGNVTDQNSNPLAINNYTFGFDSRISSSVLIGDRTVQLEFEVELDEGQVLSTSDFSALPTLGNCAAVVIDNEDPEILRLTFEQALVPDATYTVSWQNLMNAFNHKLPNYFTSVTNDQTPPSVTDHLILSENTLWLKYSERLNETSAEFLLNYTIAPDIGYPTAAKYTEADSSVLLEFSPSFVESTSYTLTIDNLEDLSDNALLDFDIAFTFAAPEVPDFGDLIITEIMADPTPEVGLSDKEYLEIFNTTSESISLGGIRIVDEGGSTTIVSGEIEANGYLVLTSTSGAANFSGVATLGITSFPSLNNAGETISLYAGEKQIFSTSYSTTWYKNSDKEDGGWALEMIDVGNPCGEYNNWTASTNPLGGTPGLVNSVQSSNPDNFGPALLTAIATDESNIELTVNEKLNPESVEHAQFVLTPARSIAEANLISPQHTQIELTLSEVLETGQSYDIELSQISDCLLNTIQKEQNKATFRLPEEASEGDLIINEVLFNPRAGGVDFVEIYNQSEKAINLKNWGLGDKVDDQKIITQENLVLNPTEYLALTTDPALLILEYPKGDATRMTTMNSFPSLSDTEDSVLLISDQGILIDQMAYQDDYHFNLLSSDDGVSLERISFEAESLNPDSWKSAASTVDFATPGVVNSQFQSSKPSSATVSIDPRVFVPDNTGMNDYTTIAYQLDQSGRFANVHIYSTNGILIKTLAEGELLSTTGFFTWDGITNNGSLAGVGYYVVIFETFDGQGNKSLQKETVVLGARF